MCKECGVEIRGGSSSPLYDHVPLCADCAEKDWNAHGGRIGPKYAVDDTGQRLEEQRVDQCFYCSDFAIPGYDGFIHTEGGDIFCSEACMSKAYEEHDDEAIYCD